MHPYALTTQSDSGTGTKPHVSVQITNAHAQTGKLQVDLLSATAVDVTLQGRLSADYSWQDILSVSATSGEVWDVAVMPEMRVNVTSANGTYRIGIGV